MLVEAHDRLLVALGTSSPKPPTYAPKGTTIVQGREADDRLNGSVLSRLRRA